MQVVGRKGDHGCRLAHGQALRVQEGADAVQLGIVDGRLTQSSATVSQGLLHFGADSGTERHDDHAEGVHNCTCQGAREGWGNTLPRQGITPRGFKSRRDIGKAAIGQAAFDCVEVSLAVSAGISTSSSADSLMLCRLAASRID